MHDAILTGLFRSAQAYIQIFIPISYVKGTNERDSKVQLNFLITKSTQEHQAHEDDARRHG